MKEEKRGIMYKAFRSFISHPWLKIISLVLAILVWLYVKGELK